MLVSDMQRAGWTGSLDNWNLEPGVDFEPVLAARADGVNRYFGEVSVRVHRVGDEAVVQFDGRMEVAEPAEGPEADAPFLVSLDVNGRKVDEVTIDPAGVKRFSFRRVADRNGFEQGDLSLADDVLPTDNKYYFTYLVDDRPSVLVIDGASRVSSGLIRNDGYFLEKAFSPGVGTRSIAPFAIDVRGRDRLRAVPANTDVVFVANLPSLSQQEVGAIQRYVEQGGNVVISFGEQTDVAAYSRSLQNLGIGSATSLVSSGDAIVGQVDRRHPVFAPFVGPGGGTILKPQFRRFVDVAPATDAQILATYDTGEPFLLEKRLGAGSILVYTSTFGNAWTDFPINEMFVPFVYQLARHASTDDQRDLMYTIGDVVRLDGPPQSTWEVRTPTGAVYRVTTDSVGVGLYARTEWPGQYLAARGAVRVPFSVNLDRSESELIARDVEEAYAGVVSPSVEQPEFMENASLTVEAEEKKQKLWRWVLLAALLVFAIETVLSNRPRRS